MELLSEYLYFKLQKLFHRFQFSGNLLKMVLIFWRSVLLYFYKTYLLAISAHHFGPKFSSMHAG